jgi:hypothetical protein
MKWGNVVDNLPGLSSPVIEAPGHTYDESQKKAARYPWVTITISLAFGLLLGGLLKPGDRQVGSPRQEKLAENSIN